MELNEFVQNFAEQFESTDSNTFTPSTYFRNLDEWSSIVGLGVLSMCGEIYGVMMTPQELKSSETIEDFYEKVKNKL